MQTITVSRIISMGHRLPSYNGICNSLHGHNVKVELTIQTDEFLDFKKVDDLLHNFLTRFDHAMVLVSHDPLVPVLKEWNQRLVVLSEEPSTEVLAQVIFNHMYIQVGPLIVTGHCTLISTRVFETDKYSAEVRTPKDGIRILEQRS